MESYSIRSANGEHRTTFHDMQAAENFSRTVKEAPTPLGLHTEQPAISESATRFSFTTREPDWLDKTATTRLSDVLRSVKRALVHVDGATRFLRESELARSDEQLAFASKELEEAKYLAAEASIAADGLGLCVSSCHTALRQHGELPTAKQLAALRHVLVRIRSQPFLSFKEARGLRRNLSGAGLVPQPRELERLADLEPL